MGGLQHSPSLQGGEEQCVVAALGVQGALHGPKVAQVGWQHVLLSQVPVEQIIEPDFFIQSVSQDLKLLSQVG